MVIPLASLCLGVFILVLFVTLLCASRPPIPPNIFSEPLDAGNVHGGSGPEGDDDYADDQEGRDASDDYDGDNLAAERPGEDEAQDPPPIPETLGPDDQFAGSDAVYAEDDAMAVG